MAEPTAPYAPSGRNPGFEALGPRAAAASASWADEARCVGEPIEVFFPPEDLLLRVGPRRALERARELCAACPVRNPCLAEDLTYPRGERWGFRAGLTEAERQALPPPPPQGPPHGTTAGYQAERRAGVEPCEPCRQANARTTAHRRARAA